MDGTCGWPCNSNRGCRQGNVNPGNNRFCFRGLCTCASQPALENGLDIKKSPRSFICPGSAPCTDISVGVVNPLETIGCVTDILDCRDDDPTVSSGWNSSCATYGTCGIGGYGYIWELPTLLVSQCWAQTGVGSHTSLPCPMSQRGRCAQQTFDGYNCGPFYDVECCFCGNKEWVDTDLYCSRTTNTFFECVRNADCPGPQTCTYDSIADFGFCS